MSRSSTRTVLSAYERRLPTTTVHIRASTSIHPTMARTWSSRSGQTCAADRPGAVARGDLVAQHQQLAIIADSPRHPAATSRPPEQYDFLGSGRRCRDRFARVTGGCARGIRGKILIMAGHAGVTRRSFLARRHQEVGRGG
jgi:hypothetical protein